MNREQAINYLKKNALITSEVCEMLEISKQRVAKLTKDGVLKPFKQSGNGSFYFRGDILTYKHQKMNGSRMGHHMFDQVRAISLTGNTRDALRFFREHIQEFDTITNAYFYFDDLDAAIDGYYVLENLEGENGLYRLSMPTCVLKDKNGQQMWLDGVNCGYGGTGPSGSVELLLALGVAKTQTRSVFDKRVVKFIRDEDKWEFIARDAAVDKFDRVGSDLQVSLYYRNGNLILIQDKNNFTESRGIDYLKRYDAFVPDVVETIVIPAKETARKEGYFKENPYGRMNAMDYYQVILIDASGRELWLHADLDDTKKVKDNQDLMELIKMCGFGCETKEKNLLKQMITKLVSNDKGNKTKITYIR